MTNEEAISIITQIKGIITNDNSWSDVAKVAVKEAFDLAIKTLEEKIQKENKVNVICFVDGDEVARFENVNNDITPDFVSLKALLGFKEKNNDK